MEELSGTPEPEQLYVLWTSGDREVALKMVFMYTNNSKLKGWWKNVCLIVWGPSAQLLAVDPELQDYVARMRHIGVEVVACKACTDAYGVTPALEAMGIEVKPMGQTLTNLLKAGRTVITF